MGEFSKMVGDVGEDIVNKILKLAGWNNLITNKYIDCNKAEHEKKRMVLILYFHISHH